MKLNIVLNNYLSFSASARSKFYQKINIMSLKKKFLKSKPICKVTFSLPLAAADGAKQVKLVGDFNNWKWKKGIPMKKINGQLQTTVELEKDKQYQFRYLMDNQIWENDWAADDYEQSPYGTTNSVVTT